MPSSEERLAYLEGRVEEHTRGFEELRSAIGRLDDHILAVDRKVDAFREELLRHIQAGDGSLSGRIDTVEQNLSGRIDAVDAKVERFHVELDRKMSRQFTWIVGLQVTMLLAILSVLIR